MSRTAADVERAKLAKRQRARERAKARKQAALAAGRNPKEKLLDPETGLPYKPGHHPNTIKSRIAPWNPETAPKHGGRPKSDMAATIARAIFENNSQMIYDAMSKELSKGSAYAFEKLAERDFGKLKEQLQLSGTEEMVSRLAAGRKRAMEGKK